jgi:hypothetical protein
MGIFQCLQKHPRKRKRTGQEELSATASNTHFSARGDAPLRAVKPGVSSKKCITNLF